GEGCGEEGLPVFGAMVVPPLTTIVWPMIKVTAREAQQQPDTGDVCGSPRSHRRFVDLRGGRRYTSRAAAIKVEVILWLSSDGSPSPPPQCRCCTPAHSPSRAKSTASGW